MIRRLAPLAAALVALLAVLLWPSGEDPYRLRLVLSNASGLRDGSRVAVSGVDAGSVSLRAAGRRQVIANLEIDRDKGPVGKDVAAQITALNLLGQKRVNLVKGNTRDAAPSGYTIPAGRVVVTTDLDQIVSVLDEPTRARLGILVNQAGLALYGRRMDLGVLADELAPVFDKTTTLLNDLTADNAALGRVVTSSDRFVTSMTAERRSLAQLVRDAATTGDAMTRRRAELAATLERAPATLAQARRFFAELEATAVPLGPAARELRTTAPQLQRTLNELAPFRRAATPTLKTATRVAPTLTRLARGATPTLRRTVPVADRLTTFTTSLRPVLRAAGGSIDNLVGTLENWARAIQFRDGLSHVFRGEASITPDTLESFLHRLQAGPKQSRKRSRKTRPHVPAASAPERESSGPTPAVPNVVQKVVPVLGDVLDDVGKAVEGLLGSDPRGRSDGDSGTTTSLLDYLLGK